LRGIRRHWIGRRNLCHRSRRWGLGHFWLWLERTKRNSLSATSSRDHWFSDLRDIWDRSDFFWRRMLSHYWLFNRS
jgi:hypothetical protein